MKKKPLSFWQRCQKSILAPFFSLILLGIFAAYFHAPLSIIFIGAALVYIRWNRKQFNFESLLSLDLLAEKWGFYRAFDAVGKKGNLFLGRIPLFNKKDQEALKKENIGFVLSIIEPFEEITPGVVFQPLPSEYFFEEGIERVFISHPDMTKLPLNTLERGVSLIKGALDAGKNVYVHCKSGKGRSACLVAAYLLTEKISTLRGSSVNIKKVVEETIFDIKQKRKQISLKRNILVLEDFALKKFNFLK